MPAITVLVTHPAGLHARPAALFVKAANKFAAEIKVGNLTAGVSPVNAKSIISVLTLGVMASHTIGLEANGADADAALANLRALVESNFGEA